jgi:hypothetical protein
MDGATPVSHVRINLTMINASGACGSGSSVLVYSTSDHEHDVSGATVNHGSFEVGGPDRSRVEVVELNLPHICVRVVASDVRDQIDELLSAVRRTRDARIDRSRSASAEAISVSCEGRERLAFRDLSRAVMRAAAGHVTAEHLQEIARLAREDGERSGASKVRAQMRELIGL